MRRNNKAENDSMHQSNLNDFTNGKTGPIDPEKRERQLSVTRAKWYLLQFFIETVKSMRKNSILVDIIHARYLRMWSEIEKKGIFFVKTMPNGKKLAFKRWYCLNGLDAWKKCEDYKCSALRYIEDQVCPYDAQEYESTDENVPHNPE